jgi:outer membrane protein
VRWLLAAALACVAGVAHAEPKIAYVDLQRAVDESTEGKQAKARLEAEFDKRQRELDAQKDELRRLLEREPQKPELLERELTIEKRGQKLQRELDEKQAAEGSKVMVRLKAVIAQLAAARKLDWVLDSSAVLSGPPGSDLTAEVVRKLNAK